MQAMNFKILRESPAPDVEKAWRDYLGRIEFPSHYEAPEYFVEPLWAGKQRFAVLAFEGDTVRGVVTGIHAGKNVMCGLPARPQMSIDSDGAGAAILEALLQGVLAETESDRKSTRLNSSHL